MSDPLDLALTAALGLKPGTWEAVESLAFLAMEVQDRSEARELLTVATRTAERLKPGSWDSVRALAWLARAERALAD